MVHKIKTTQLDDIFVYRDEYNEEKTISFPKFWRMTEVDVENWLNI